MRKKRRNTVSLTKTKSTQKWARAPLTRIPDEVSDSTHLNAVHEVASLRANEHVARIRGVHVHPDVLPLAQRPNLRQHVKGAAPGRAQRRGDLQKRQNNKRKTLSTLPSIEMERMHLNDVQRRGRAQSHGQPGSSPPTSDCSIRSAHPPG